jgi:hypothetical protein
MRWHSSANFHIAMGWNGSAYFSLCHAQAHSSFRNELTFISPFFILRWAGMEQPIFHGQDDDKEVRYLYTLLG